ncbi:MAG TPA: patatin-like phospholipase family protein [Acidimicrobiia bacterium]
MPRIGLVLGAGGVVGHAFHAGVLAELAAATGWDPRTAEVVVGTSAGSVVGALLRAGVSAPDLAARATGAPLSPEGARLAARAGGPAPIPSRPPPRGGGLPRMASPATFLKAALPRFPPVRPGALAAAALPAGRVPTELVAAGLRPLFTGWPERDLWLCAVRLDTGRRVVFGQQRAPDAVHVADAAAASCAIPGFFEPVEIGGVRYVDGGAHSPTNADLLAGRGLDLVIVSSPMSVAGNRVRPSLDMPARRLTRLYLGREAGRVRRAGTPVLAFQPVAADLAVMGLNAMDPARRDAVTRQARESTRRRLARPDVRDRLEVLRSARAATR